MAERRRHDRDDEGYHSDYNAPRRHRSQPPKGRKSGPIEEEPSQRPKLVTRDDSYYDPRDVYYLSDAEGPEEHPWFAQQREDEALDRREDRRDYRSSRPSSRRRNHSHDSSLGHRKSSRAHSLHSHDSRPASSRRHRSRSKELHRRQRDEDEREARHSRRSDSRGSGDHRRSKTVAPSRDRSRPASPHPSRRGTHRDSRDHKYPPSARRSDRVRSSTQPAKARTRSRSSSLSPIDQIKEHKDALMSAGKAMLQTGAMAAVKMHGEEGDWIGMKGAKVLSTALSAAAVDTFIERKKPHMSGGMRHSAVKQAAQVALVNLVAKPAVKKTKLGK